MQFYHPLPNQEGVNWLTVGGGGGGGGGGDPYRGAWKRLALGVDQLAKCQYL